MEILTEEEKLLLRELRYAKASDYEDDELLEDMAEGRAS
jgi:hypothetical protein